MYKIRVDTLGFQNTVKNAKHFLDDLTPFFEKEGSQVIYDEIREVFNTQGYGRWPRLSVDYAKWKKMWYPHQPLLRLENDYFLAATSHGKSPLSFRKVSPRRLRIGVTGPDYAIYHEKGTDMIPSRPVFKYAAERIRLPLLSELKEYLFKARKVVDLRKPTVSFGGGSTWDDYHDDDINWISDWLNSRK